MKLLFGLLDGLLEQRDDFAVEAAVVFFCLGNQGSMYISRKAKADGD